MKNLTIIAAVGKNLELGKDNKLIWHFKEDMQFFRDNTINKPIVMGMNTLKSLPKLLPKRTHIVLTRQNKDLDPSIIVVHSIDELLDYVEKYKDEVMVIGGASIYQFDKNDWNSEVIGEHDENNIKYKHLVYTRKI